jgi:hypothetical protein
VLGYVYTVIAKYQLLRKFTAILLLATFFISQYAKQTGYLKCRLANYFSTNAIKCDCEKILLTGNSSATSIPAPVPHNHLHLDELFYPSQPLLKEGVLVLGNLFLPTVPTMLHDGDPQQIDRPPQVG